jgi:anti-sigma B factor antagonist
MTNKHLDIQTLGDVQVVGFTCARIPDNAIIEELKEELRQVAVSSSKVVLDFAKVEYLSSAALGVIIIFDKQTKMRSCRVQMCNLRAEILEVFQITKLDTLFAICTDREAALRKLAT